MTTLADRKESVRILRRNVPLFAAVGAVWMVVVSAPRIVPLGPVTLSGAATIMIAAAAGLALAALPIRLATQQNQSTQSGRSAARTQVPAALFLFLAVLLVSAATTGAAGQLDVDALQNVCVYGTFVAAIAACAHPTPSANLDRGWMWLRRAGAILPYLALVDQISRVGLLGARPMAIAGLLAIAVTTPGRSENRWVQCAPYVMVLAIALSLSRTGTILSLALLAFLVLRRPRGFRAVKSVFMFSSAAIAAYFLITEYAPFRDRFTVGDGYTIGGISISTQGRSTFWELLVSHAEQHWAFGGGVGSAARLISAFIPGQSHPHNDFLRFYFEFGLVGVTLFAVGYLLLLVRVFRNARISDHPLHWAATIGLIAVGLTALTDNPFVYPFVMIPLGSLAGMSLAFARREGAGSVDLDHDLEGHRNPWRGIDGDAQLLGRDRVGPPCRRRSRRRRGEDADVLRRRDDTEGVRHRDGH